MKYTEILDRLNLSVRQFLEMVSETDNFDEIAKDPEEKKFCEIIKFFLKDFYTMIIEIWESVLNLAYESEAYGNYSHFFEHEFKSYVKPVLIGGDFGCFDKSMAENKDIYVDFRNNLYVYYHETKRGKQFEKLSRVITMIIRKVFYEESFEALLAHDERVRNATMDWSYRVNYPMISAIIKFILPGIPKCFVGIDLPFLDKLLEISFRRREEFHRSYIAGFGQELVQRYQDSEEMELMKEIIDAEIFGIE